MQFIPDGAMRLDMALVYGVCASLKKITDQYPTQTDCAIEYTHTQIVDKSGSEISVTKSIYGSGVILRPEDYRSLGADKFKYAKHKMKVSQFSSIYIGTAVGSISGYELNMVCVAPEEYKGRDISIILQPPYNKCLPSGDEEDSPVPGPYEYPVNIRDIAHRVRQALATGAVSSFIISDGTGKIISIPQEVWRTQLADYIINNDAPAVFVDQNQVYSGKVLVKFDDFARLFEFEEACSLKNGAYVPPYISFSLKAVVDLDLSREQRMPKKQIIHWLERNWPREMLGEPSATKIEYMATFLRQPEHENAGAFRTDQRQPSLGLKVIADNAGK